MYHPVYPGVRKISFSIGSCQLRSRKYCARNKFFWDPLLAVMYIQGTERVPLLVIIISLVSFIPAKNYFSLHTLSVFHAFSIDNAHHLLLS